MSVPESNARHSALSRVYFWMVLASAITFLLAVRGRYFAELPSLFGDLKTGPLGGISEFWFAALRAGFGLCIFGSSLAIGHLVDRALAPESVPEHSHVLELGRKVTLGACLWIGAIVAAARFEMGSVIAAAVAAIATLPLLQFFARRAREAGGESRVPEKATAADRVAALLIVGFVGIAFLAAIASGTFAAASVFWAVPVLVMSAFGWARESGLSRRSSLAAAALVTAVPAVFYAAPIEFRDVLLVVISVFAAIAAFRTFTLRSGRWAATLLLFIGGLAALYFG